MIEHCKNMVFSLGVAVTIALLGSMTALGQPAPDVPAEIDHAFDFAPLVELAQLRKPPEVHEDLPLLVRRNLYYVYHNRLNTRSFLSQPSPEHIARRAMELMSLNEEIDLLLQDGQVIVSSDTRPSLTEVRSILRNVRKSSRRLGDVYRRNFSTVTDQTLRLKVPLFEADSREFRFYLSEARRVHGQLSRALDRFFLNPEPGAISLQDYEMYSVPVLSEALSRLSREMESRIKGWR